MRPDRVQLDIHPGARASVPSAAVVRDALGEEEPVALRESAGALARELPVPNAALCVGALTSDQQTALAEGLALGSYRFTLARERRPRLRRVELYGADLDQAALDRGLRWARAASWARDLSNMPAVIATPAWLAAQAETRLRPLGVRVSAYGPDWLTEHRFGGVLAVAAGAVNPPRLIEASWRPRGARPGAHLVLVGKGITFDTGGINLKPGANMGAMQTDMSGAAAALAALEIIAAERVPVRVTVLAPCAENAFSGSAYRPGDVIRHVGGRTTEVNNTDAEGRIVLADALAWAVSRLRPTAVVDIATLTGGIKVALGTRTAGLFGTDDALAERLAAAGALVAEPLWRLPLRAEYEPLLHSEIADAKQSAGNPQSITAAMFLRPFAADVPWAHLDIAGTGRAGATDGYLIKGATGFGARLLAGWAESVAAAG